MTGLTRGAVVLILAALFTVGVSWKLQMDNTARLEAEIEQIEKRFRDMQEQHEKAIEAGEKAARARDEIHGMMNGRALELENLLNSCPDVSGLELPDSLRDFLQNACARPGASTQLFDGSNKPAGSERHKYGW